MALPPVAAEGLLPTQTQSQNLSPERIQKILTHLQKQNESLAKRLEELEAYKVKQEERNIRMYNLFHLVFKETFFSLPVNNLDQLLEYFEKCEEFEESDFYCEVVGTYNAFADAAFSKRGVKTIINSWLEMEELAKKANTKSKELLVRYAYKRFLEGFSRLLEVGYFRYSNKTDKMAELIEVLKRMLKETKDWSNEKLVITLFLADVQWANDDFQGAFETIESVGRGHGNCILDFFQSRCKAKLGDHILALKMSQSSRKKEEAFDSTIGVPKPMQCFAAYYARYDRLDLAMKHSKVCDKVANSIIKKVVAENLKRYPVNSLGKEGADEAKAGAFIDEVDRKWNGCFCEDANQEIIPVTKELIKNLLGIRNKFRLGEQDLASCLEKGLHYTLSKRIDEEGVLQIFEDDLLNLA